MSPTYPELFQALTAEVMVAATAFIVLTVDLVASRRTDVKARRQTAAIVVVGGLLLTMIQLVGQLGLGTNSRSLWDGVLVVSDLNLMFKVFILGLTVLTALISMAYDVGKHVGEYFAILLFGAIGMLLLVGTEDLVMIFVALELTSLSLYILTAFHKNWLRSQEAALKYFMFGAIASAFLLFGMSYLIGATGTTHLDAMKHAAVTGNNLAALGLLFMLVGFGFKVAVVPFHLWAPDAYEGAPTPVTAFIATGSKVASFVVLLKVMYFGLGGMMGSAFWGGFQPGWAMLLALIAAASMILGNVVAIVQHNIKRMLANTSIAHAGYILIGLIAATQVGAASVFFYLIVYSLTNLGAFGVVAALASRAGGETLSDFNGMARRAPFLSLTMLVFVLSLAGIPPLGGFFGKFYLFAAAVERDSEHFGLLWLVVLGILASAVSLYYYLVLLKHLYVEKPADGSRIVTPFYLNVTLGCIALAVIGLGLFPEPILALLNSLASRL